MNKQLKTCPNCGYKLAEIVYGMPSSEIMEDLEKEEAFLGGCEILLDIEQPKYHCYKCKKEFNKDLTENTMNYEEE